MPKKSPIERRRALIEREYDEPLEDVARGYAELGYSVSFTAKTLGYKPETFDLWAKRQSIAFPKSKAPGKAEIFKGRPNPRLSRALRNAARKITWKGRSLCLQDWSSILNIRSDTLRIRLARNWSVNRAFSTRPMSKGTAGSLGARKRWRLN